MIAIPFSDNQRALLIIVRLIFLELTLQNLEFCSRCNAISISVFRSWSLLVISWGELCSYGRRFDATSFEHHPVGSILDNSLRIWLAVV